MFLADFIKTITRFQFVNPHALTNEYNLLHSALDEFLRNELRARFLRKRRMRKEGIKKMWWNTPKQLIAFIARCRLHLYGSNALEMSTKEIYQLLPMAGNPDRRIKTSFFRKIQLRPNAIVCLYVMRLCWYCCRLLVCFSDLTLLILLSSAGVLKWCDIADIVVVCWCVSVMRHCWYCCRLLVCFSDVTLLILSPFSAETLLTLLSSAGVLQ